jgi:hypothetical protein
MYSYMFEVVLMLDYEEVVFFRDFEVSYGSGGSEETSPNRSKSRSNSPQRSARRDRSFSPQATSGFKRTSLNDDSRNNAAGNTSRRKGEKRGRIQTDMHVTRII